MRAVLVLSLFLISLSFGCLLPTPPPQNNQTTLSLASINETELAAKYGCDFGAAFEKNVSSGSGKAYLVYECVFEQDFTQEKPFVYMVDRHPGATGLVSYIFVEGGKERVVSNSSELAPLFTPINSESVALDYVVLAEGLWAVESVEKAPGEKPSVKKNSDGWSVRVLHRSKNKCPCYGAYFASDYLVKEDGAIEEKERRNIYSYGPQETGCIC